MIQIKDRTLIFLLSFFCLYYSYSIILVLKESIALRKYFTEKIIYEIRRFMRMNKFVHFLMVFASVFITMQISTLDTTEAGKYPRIRADAGDDFKVFENKEVELDGSEIRGGFKKFVDFEWELVRINGTKVQNNNEPFEINNDDKSKASFMAPEVLSGEATYEFKLTVRDEIDREDDDTVMVHVMSQQPPVGPT
jgi:hypothetical protein